MARDNQAFWMVAILNVAGSFAATEEVSHLLELFRQGNSMTSLPESFWTFELWMTSIAFSQWSVRTRRSGAAVVVAMLPLIAGIAIRVAASKYTR